jgi:hypothetical protein
MSDNWCKCECHDRGSGYCGSCMNKHCIDPEPSSVSPPAQEVHLDPWDEKHTKATTDVGMPDYTSLSEELKRARQELYDARNAGDPCGHTSEGIRGHAFIEGQPYNKCLVCQVLHFKSELERALGYLISCPWCGELMGKRAVSAQISHLIEHGDKFNSARQSSEAELSRVNLERDTLQDSYDSMTLEAGRYRRKGNESRDLYEAEKEVRKAAEKYGYSLHCDAPEHGCQKVIALVREAIHLTREQTQWIPVSERLPENGRYLVIANNVPDYSSSSCVATRAKMTTGNYYSQARPVGWWTDEYQMLEVTHWQPLPSPPISVTVAGKESK